MARPVPRLVDTPRAPVGDFYSPYYRVKLFASLSSVRAFSDRRKAEIKRENQGFAPVANGVPGTPPITGGSTLDKIDEYRTRNQTTDQTILDDLDLGKYASELTLEVLSTEACKFELTLTPPYDQAVLILEHNIIQYDHCYVFVEFGYASKDGESDIRGGPFLFLMTNPNATFADTNITITLSGFDILSSETSRQENKRTFERGKYSTDFKIIEEYANNLKLKLDTRSLIGSPIFNPKSHDRKQDSTDWLFFKKVCEENQVGFYAPGRTLFLYDRRTSILHEKPRYTLLYRSRPISEYDVPIESVTFDTRNDLFQNRKSRDIRRLVPDRDTGELIETVVSSANPGNNANNSKNTRAGDKGSDQTTSTPLGNVAEKAIPSNQSGYNMSGSMDDEEFQGRVRSLAIEWASLGGIKATITIPMIPSLLPSQQVVLQGVPKPYVNSYMIQSVKHTMGSGGFKTELVANKSGPALVIGGAQEAHTPSADNSAVADPVLTARPVTNK